MPRFNVPDYVAGDLPLVCIAHRGFSGRFPENTLLAFEKAIEAGADMIEFDVQLSSDEALVVYHDPTLVKVCANGLQQTVTGTALIDLQGIDLGMDQRIPTLEQVLEQCAGRIGMNIHLKTSGSISDRTIELCRQAGILQDVFFAVQQPEEFTRLRTEQPDAWLCSLFHRTLPGMVDENAALGVRILQPGVGSLIEGGRELVDRARAAGIVMGVFYADQYAQFRWMQRLGVAGILTNHPDVMLDCVGGRHGQCGRRGGR